MLRTTWRPITALALAVALLGACSEPLPEEQADTGTGSSTSEVPGCSGDDLLACAEDTTLAPYLPDEPTAATGDPIRIGMVNQENTPAGSYPELSQAVAAGLRFINEDLGGIDGRPLEVEVCNTEFSAEGSTACGQRFVEAEAPAVLGGIDVFGNAVEVLEHNDIPYIGGIPVSTQSVTSPLSFQWSGGSWGAAVAFADHASTELDAERVAVVYGDFGSITDSAEAAQQVLESRGVEVTMVPFPILATDIGSPLTVAAAADPDAVFVLAADTACTASFEGLAALDLDAQAYFVGACATPAIIDAAGPEATDGAIFNVEGEVGDALPNDDMLLYATVIETYGVDGLDPIGAGTVTYRALMNLFMVLSDIDGEVTPEAIAEALRGAVDAPSYAGHAYTCDGEQFEGLPSMCSPQQILAQMTDGELAQLGTWVDVGAVIAES